MMNFKKNGGFTLVELIVVIAILAILAGVAIPAYSGYIEKAKDAAVITKLDAIQTAAQAANATAGGIQKIVVTTAGEGSEAKTTVVISAASFASKYADDFAMFYNGKKTANTDASDTAPATITIELEKAVELSGTSYKTGAYWFATQELADEQETTESAPDKTYASGWNAKYVAPTT